MNVAVFICVFFSFAYFANCQIEYEETNGDRGNRVHRVIGNTHSENKENKPIIFVAVDKHGSIESMSNGASMSVFTRNGEVVVYSSIGDKKVPVSDAPFVITNNEDGNGLIVRPMTKEDEEMIERRNTEIRDRIMEGQRLVMKRMQEMHRMMQQRMASMFHSLRF